MYISPGDQIINYDGEIYLVEYTKGDLIFTLRNSETYILHRDRLEWSLSEWSIYK